MLLTGYIDSVDQHLHTITKSVMNINNEIFFMFQTGCFLSKVGNFNFRKNYNFVEIYFKN